MSERDKGFGGHSFIDKCLEKRVSRISEKGEGTYRNVIKVDGTKAECLILRPCDQPEVIVIWRSDSAGGRDAG
jgi:pentose-5-phosphate-3-epimerase